VLINRIIILKLCTWVNGLILNSLVPKTVQSYTAFFVMKTVVFVQQFAACCSQEGHRQVKHVAKCRNRILFKIKVIVFG
jgi:hypothetical protein